MENTRAISDIKIGNRARKDMGDIAGLAHSIETLGLLHPVVISKTDELIAGERRIRAYEQLGETQIPVTVIDLAEIVRGEHAENLERKEFTLTEAVAIKRAVEPMLAAEARARQAAAGPATGRGKKATAGASLAPGVKGKTRDNVAKVTGKKRTTLAKAEEVIEAAEAEPEKFAPLVEEMDRTGKVDGAYKQLKTLKASPADVAKADRAEMRATAAKLAASSPPDVSSAADRAEPDDDPYMEDDYEDTPAGRRRKARHAREKKKSSDDLFESLAATGKLSDDEIADYRESGIMPAYTLTSPCGTPMSNWKPDQAEVEKARADRAAAKAKLGADAVAPSDDQRKAALRLAVENDNVVTFEPKDGFPVKDADPLDSIEGDDPDNVDITDATFGAHAIHTALSTIDLAQTTAADFWKIFDTSHLMPGTVEWLDTSIKKLAEIKAAQPKATKAAS